MPLTARSLPRLLLAALVLLLLGAARVSGDGPESRSDESISRTVDCFPRKDVTDMKTSSLTTTPSTPLPVLRPDRDPRYVQQAAQIASLRNRLHEAEQRAGTRPALIDAIEQRLIDASGAELLDGPSASAEALRRERQRLLDEQEGARLEIPRLRSAIAQGERRLTEIENVVTAELAPVIRARHRALCERLHAALVEASGINAELLDLTRAAGGWLNLELHGWPELQLVTSPKGDDYLRSAGGSSKLSQWHREFLAAGYGG